MKNYYEILGLKRSATDTEIKLAYRELAKLSHPELNKGDEKAAERFAEVNEAYEILSDKIVKRSYDEVLAEFLANYLDDDEIYDNVITNPGIKRSPNAGVKRSQNTSPEKIRAPKNIAVTGVEPPIAHIFVFIFSLALLAAAAAVFYFYFIADESSPLSGLFPDKSIPLIILISAIAAMYIFCAIAMQTSYRSLKIPRSFGSEFHFSRFNRHILGLTPIAGIIISACALGCTVTVLIGTLSGGIDFMNFLQSFEIVAETDIFAYAAFLLACIIAIMFEIKYLAVFIKRTTGSFGNAAYYHCGKCGLYAYQLFDPRNEVLGYSYGDCGSETRDIYSNITLKDNKGNSYSGRINTGLTKTETTYMTLNYNLKKHYVCRNCGTSWNETVEVSLVIGSIWYTIFVFPLKFLFSKNFRIVYSHYKNSR